MKDRRETIHQRSGPRTVELKIPVGAAPEGETNIRNFNPQPRLSETAADGLERLYWGVRGQALRSGDFVDSRPKAVSWLLERIAQVPVS